MCGITGIMRLGEAAIDPAGGLIDRMTDTLTHRGPNDRGTWTDHKIALGHRRLSVIDLSRAGRQPMGNADGTVQIVYNGETYNFRELRKKYKLDEKYEFRSTTDSEVVLYLYLELGLDMVREMNGMFALAIWDQRQQALHLVRDRFGIKPLFYQRDDQFFRFGSEIKAIIADQRVVRKPSAQALYDFLTFDYIPGQQTAFEGISEVPPCHVMTVRGDGSAEMHRYFDLYYNIDSSIDEQTAIEQSFELMDRSIQRRLIADVPVGVLLSGGMDSSAAVALMDRHRTEPVHTYSVGFEDTSFNELPYARIVAKTFGCISREVIVTSQLVRDLLPKYLSYIDEPYADGSAIPTYYVCELAKDEVVVVLSGEGGDECFAGYDTYMAWKASSYFKKVPRAIRQGLIAPVVNSLPVSDKKLSFEFKAKRFLGGQELPTDEAHMWWRVVLPDADKQAVLHNNVVEQALLPSSRFFKEVYGRSHADEELNRLMHIDCSVFLPDDLMIKNDRMSMAHSLEARVPFCDPELMTYLSRVPPHLKLKGRRKKHLMRKAMEGILPQEIVDKKKVGLEMPYGRWLKGELNDVLNKYCDPGRMEATGLFNGDHVQRITSEHLDGKVDRGRALWGLLNYMMWYDLYIS